MDDDDCGLAVLDRVGDWRLSFQAAKTDEDWKLLILHPKIWTSRLTLLFVCRDAWKGMEGSVLYPVS